MKREEFLEKICNEVTRAYNKHGKRKWGRHEFYGIVKEEFDEMWEVIMTDGPDERLEEEMIQVAAMCLRFAETGNRYASAKSHKIRRGNLTLETK